MSYIERANQIKQNADKAAQLDQLMRDQESKQLQQASYDKGAQDILADVDRQLASAAKAYALDNQWQSMVRSMTSKSDSYPLSEEDVMMITGDRDPSVVSAELKALRSKESGRLSFDDLAFLSRPGGHSSFVQPESSSPYNSLAKEIQAELDNNIANKAIDQAIAEGDTSEENINRLINLYNKGIE